jgi:hypothetical protein
MSDSYYDTAQICLNGHVVTSMANSYPQHCQKYCDKCGAETITACLECNVAIRGYYHVPGFIGFSDYDRPAYCHNCGRPFPWTISGLEAASKLADELENLSDEEKEQLKSSFQDLIMDTPKTVVAETRFKKLLKKAGSDAYEGMKAILIDIVSETVRKSIFGQ